MPSCSNLARKTEFRRQVRYPIKGMIRIIWQDGTGRERVCNAQLVNISLNGMQLRVDEKIPLRAYVSCNDETLRIRGTGSVRYCNFAKGKYEIGLEFAGGTGWREPVNPPE
jgi:hypothetical protein